MPDQSSFIWHEFVTPDQMSSGVVFTIVENYEHRIRH